jgi:3-hydroxymyristoyl/3-hydroxydecanoyl-(acyl carrier protein) dehydratase
MKGYGLDTDQIIDLIEVTPPFLMIDYAVKVIPGKSCYTIKTVKEKDWFFDCHLKTEMTMPGVLLIESMLQTLILAIYTMDGHKGKLAFVSDIRTKLISKVLPNSVLHIYADLLSSKRGISKGIVKIKVNKIEVCQGEFELISPHQMPIPRRE